MTDTDLEKLKHEANQKLLEYITLLETTNDTLLTTLRQSVSLLSQFAEAVPDPVKFKELLGHLNQIIQAGEQVAATKETLH